jgi:hypothetical protein
MNTDSRQAYRLTSRTRWELTASTCIPVGDSSKSSTSTTPPPAAKRAADPWRWARRPVAPPHTARFSCSSNNGVLQRDDGTLALLLRNQARSGRGPAATRTRRSCRSGRRSSTCEQLASPVTLSAERWSVRRRDRGNGRAQRTLGRSAGRSPTATTRTPQDTPRSARPASQSGNAQRTIGPKDRPAAEAVGASERSSRPVGRTPQREGHIAGRSSVGLCRLFPALLHRESSDTLIGSPRRVVVARGSLRA